MEVFKTDAYGISEPVIFICKDADSLSKYDLMPDDLEFVTNQFNNDVKEVEVTHKNYVLFFYFMEKDKPQHVVNNAARKAAYNFCRKLNQYKFPLVHIVDKIDAPEVTFALAEGLLLSNYQFLKYFSDKEKKTNTLERIRIASLGLSENDVRQLSNIYEAVTFARDLVNEPQSYLTAIQLSKDIEARMKGTELKVTVMDKKAIIEEGLTGLLAVNQGSVEPPTFNILEWKPINPRNSQPILLVGKGVVYDTGGLSLKPTTDSMDYMKVDMGGAAAVAGAMYAAAKAEIPLHIIGLIPATDNRPSGEAYAPGDVITMHNKMTVEVLNTDAEGRMILADAHSYGQRYNPELVIDIATLTGAAAKAVGKEAVVAMGNADKKWMDLLNESADNTYERLAWMPFWDEYFEMMKSDIADMKNVGGADAGAITAGKFLEKFTKHPYIHIDIAGSAFFKSGDSYRGKGATGIGVRLLFDFLHRTAISYGA